MAPSGFEITAGGSHFVFHLFVMLGTLCHMIAVQGVIDTM
jgi:predicted membrane channel-forming protein YqfA (hemolysin III family)